MTINNQRSKKIKIRFKFFKEAKPCIAKLLAGESNMLLDAVEKFVNQYDDAFYQRPFKVIKHFYAIEYDFYHH